MNHYSEKLIISTADEVNIQSDYYSLFSEDARNKLAKTFHLTIKKLFEYGFVYSVTRSRDINEFQRYYVKPHNYYDYIVLGCLSVDDCTMEIKLTDYSSDWVGTKKISFKDFERDYLPKWIGK